jgi:protein-L-isoaspartate(D-aspartate) O-methyltransferase
MVARMTELLAPRAGDRVLEIGTGSGYQAAILALLGAAVLTIERQPELAALARERLARLGLGSAVDVRIGDGSVGDAAGAPWDGIIVTAAAPSIPASLREQLSPDGGRLVIPVGDRHRQDLLLVRRRGDEWQVVRRRGRLRAAGWGGRLGRTGHLGACTHLLASCS